MKLIRMCILFSALINIVNPYAYASSPDSKVNKVAHIFNILSSNSMVEKNLDLLIALAPKTIKSLEIIENDMKKKLKGIKTLPQLRIVNNIVYNGKRNTGLSLISSKGTIRVKLKSKTWSFNKNKSIDKNYFSLNQFLVKVSSSTSAQNLLFEEAHAIGKRQALEALLLIFSTLVLSAAIIAGILWLTPVAAVSALLASVAFLMVTVTFVAKGTAKELRLFRKH